MSGLNELEVSDFWGHTEGLIMGLLAISNETLSTSMIVGIFNRHGIRHSNGRIFSEVSVDKALTNLGNMGNVSYEDGDVRCHPDCTWPAILNAIEKNSIDEIIGSIRHEPRARTWKDYYDAQVGRLRMALLRGDEMRYINHFATICESVVGMRDRDSFSDALGDVYYPEVVDRICIEAQARFARYLISLAKFFPENAPVLFGVIPGIIATGNTSVEVKGLAIDYMELLILGGALEDAMQFHDFVSNYFYAEFNRATYEFLRGDVAKALNVFEQSLTVMRDQNKGRILTGLSGYIYLIVSLKSPDASNANRLRQYLDQAISSARRESKIIVFKFFQNLNVSDSANVDANEIPTAVCTDHLLDSLFQGLALYWLDSKNYDEHFVNTLGVSYHECMEAELYWLGTQFASVLFALTQDSSWDEIAKGLRAKHSIVDATTWLPRQCAWQRRLSTLLGISKGTSESANKTLNQRLVWLLHLGESATEIELEAREQKRDAKNNWSKGRAIPLNRLASEAKVVEYLTDQDRQVLSMMQSPTFAHASANYVRTKLKMVGELVGHPLVFRADTPSVRLDLVNHLPVILIDHLSTANQIFVKVEPVLNKQTLDVVLVKETPTRVRVLAIGDDQRRVGMIIGEGQPFPDTAEADVQAFIKGISSRFTIMSSLDGGADGVEQRDADSRLHAHLLPHKSGLRMQLMVRPITDAGPYFAPGAGGERVIADVGGTVVQARRDLAKEVEAAEALIEQCEVLATAPQEHGEWIIESPEHCLELLLILQEVPADKILISWPEGQKFKIGKRLGAAQFQMSIKGSRDWFAANGQLQIDEQRVLDLSQLLALLKKSTGRFINLGNNEFLALTESFQRHLEDLAYVGDLDKDGVRLHPLSAAALEGLITEVAEEGELEEDEAWKENLERFQSASHYQAEVPSTLQAELRDYQLTGFTWLARLAHWGAGACLADDMGLGKTVQTIALLLHRAAGGPALVVAPTSVCLNWHAELAKFAPTLRIREFDNRNRIDMIGSLQPFDIVIVSYTVLQMDESVFAQTPWNTVVLDEAQAIKNSGTKRSDAVMKLQAGFKLAVSGTPLENHLGELFNLFRFINRGLLGSQENFNKRFASPIEREQNPVEVAAARERLRRLIQPFILRRTKTEVLTELPSRTEITLPISLSEDERTLYESLRRKAIEAIAAASGSPGEAAIRALAEIMKLRRMCCNPSLVAPELGLKSSKLNEFKDLVVELIENKHKVLVFSQFVDHLKLIRDLLESLGISYQYLDGSTPQTERRKRVEAFQGGEGDVFLISLKAGGVGINLTAADYVIHMDPWWNPAVEDQASDRAHRMGQKRPVTIYRLVTEGTIEEAIVDLHKHKRDLADSLLEGTDMSARLSAEQILSMLNG